MAISNTNINGNYTDTTNNEYVINFYNELNCNNRDCTMYQARIPLKTMQLMKQLGFNMQTVYLGWINYVKALIPLILTIDINIDETTDKVVYQTTIFQALSDFDRRKICTQTHSNINEALANIYNECDKQITKQMSDFLSKWHVEVMLANQSKVMEINHSTIWNHSQG